MRSHDFNIEIAGSCNLRCPSCPVGNSAAEGRPRGMMDVALFEQVVRKIVSETKKVGTIALYDWGEPTLHPRLPEILKIIHDHGIRSRVSSNLNVEKRLESTIRANPHELHVSLSGFYERNYSRTHRRGKIEKVKENIRELRRLIDHYDARTRVVIGFHVYRHNLVDDLPAMRALAAEVGFEIEPVVAQFLPVEKTLTYLERFEGVESTLPGVEITAEDQEIIDLLLVKPEETLEWWRGLPALQRWWANRDCERITRKTSVRSDGSVALCCATYDVDMKIEGAFLDLPHHEIQERRRAHPFCGPCMAYGLHLSAPGGPRQELADAAKQAGPRGQRSFELLEIDREPPAAPAG